MDAPTLTALQQSIERWEALSQATNPRKIELSIHRCPLCVRFMNGDYPDCHQCPVFHRTSRKYCESTPFEQAAATLSNWRSAESCGDPRSCPEQFQAAARAEAEFLRSLLPDAPPPPKPRDFDAI